MPDPQPFAVAPQEAIDYLRDKVDLPTRSWTDLWQGMHARAFVVAGAQSEALLADFHEAVARAIAEGRTLDDFRKDFDRIVETHGWSYKGGRNWRSRVILQTNLRMAYSAGRWAQIQRSKARRPYLRYVAIMDDRTRPQHRAWHDTVLPVDHEWWQSHCPPNGWNCRCSVQSLSERDLDRYGLKVTDPPPDSPSTSRRINTPSGPAAIDVPEGIDPGFAYNPGEAAFGRGAAALAAETHGAWRTLAAPGQAAMDAPGLPPLPVDRPPAAPLADGIYGEEALRQALRTALGADEAVLRDPSGGHVRLGQGFVDYLLEDAARLDGRERYIPLVPSLIADPAEIWAGWVQSEISGRVMLRRRYIRLVELDGGRAIGLVADADGREWSGLTLIPLNAASGGRLRGGHLVYRRP